MTHTTTHTHAPQILNAAQHYAHAAARYQHNRHTAQPHHIARARFLEVTAHLDTLLNTHILRTNTHTQTLTTATDAALIKAAARHLADHLTETHLGPSHTPQAAHDQLTHLIYETLTTQDTPTTPTTHEPQALAA